MKRPLKWLAGIAAGIAVLTLALALAMAWWFDADALKARVETWVENETGLALTISGELSPRLFPGVGVRVGHTALRNPAGFEGQNLAEFETFSLRVKLFPLLRGTVALDQVTVEGLNVHLVRSGSGGHNFDRLLAPGKRSDSPPPVLLALGRVKLTNAAFTYSDELGGEILRVTHLDLRADPLADGQPAALSARFQLSDSEGGVAGEVSLDAQVSADLARRVFNAQPLAARAALRGTGVPGGEIQIETSADVGLDPSASRVSVERLRLVGESPAVGDAPLAVSIPKVTLDLNAGSLSAAQIALEVAGLDMEGQIDAGGLGADPEVSGSLRVSSFSPAELMRRLGRPSPHFLEARLPRSVRLDASVSGDGRGLTLDPLAANLDEVQVEGKIHLGFAPQWPLAMALRIDTPPVTRGNPNAITLRGSGRAPEGAATYQIEAMELTLGPVTARGEAKVDTGGSELTYAASLSLPRFNPRALLDHLGRPAPETGDPKALTRIAATLVVTGSGNDLVLEPLSLTLDDTQITGSLSVTNLSGEAPAVNFALRADALDAGRYLPFSIPGSDNNTSGGWLLAIPKSLNLNGQMNVGALIFGETIVNHVQLSARSRNGRIELQTGAAPPHVNPGDRVASSAAPRPAP